MLKVVSCYDVLKAQKATKYITLKHFLLESIHVRFNVKIDFEKLKLANKPVGMENYLLKI